MDTLYDTPAQYLEKFEIIVLETRSTDTPEEPATKTFMSALKDWEDKTLGIGVYSFDQFGWSFYTDVSSYEEAERTLIRIAEQYPEKVDVEAILPVWKTYFEALPNVLYYKGEVGADYGDARCETCDDYYENSFEILYVPACPGTLMDKASIIVDWKFGCRGEELVAGDFSKKKKMVFKVFRWMTLEATSENGETIQQIVDDLTKVVEVNGL